jgi:two-component system cell cycle sensor histidine kinase/response regulator CckA
MNIDEYSKQNPSSAIIQTNRLRGETLAAWMRVVFAAAAALIFLLCKLASGTFHRAALEYFYLAGLGAALLYSLFILTGPNRPGARRAVAFISSAIDVTLVSFSICAALIYAVQPAAALISFNFLYLWYITLILLAMHRHDAANALFTGALAAVQYLLIILGLRYTPALLFRNIPFSSSWIGGMAPAELFRCFVLLLVGVLGFFLTRSITRRMWRSAEELRIGQAYLTQFFESNPEAIVLSDNDTRVLRINKAFTRLFGYTEAEAVGRPIDELVAPQRLKEEAVRLSQTAQEGQEFLLESVRRRKDGGLVDVSILGAPIFFRGNQVAIFGVYRDVTERRRKERLLQALNQAALAMQSALTREQINAAVAGELEKLGYMWTVMLLDEAGGRLKAEYLGFEPSLIRTAERLAGLSYQDCTFSPDVDQDIFRIIEKGETRFIEDTTTMLRNLLPESSKAAAEQLAGLMRTPATVGAPLIQEDRTIGLLFVHSRDLSPQDEAAITAFANQLSAALQKIGLIKKLEKNISELKRTQAELLQAQKMEAVGRLAGGIAHDFNNLLTVIRGYSELLLADFERDTAVTETIGEIQRAADQASRLTEHLLAFSRKQMHQPRVMSLNDILSGMERILQRLIGEDITLITRPGSDLRPVEIDPAQIEQVVMNLAVNARDAMPDGGKLIIETANVELGEAFVSQHPEVRPGPYVLLAMSDTGPGIEQSILPQIFEPFFTTKERGRGTGLGLSVVYGIVKQSMGYVYAENLSGQGARFTLYFPPSPQQPPSSKADDRSEQNLGGSQKILLVEDDDNVRRLTATILERNGYSVLAARSGEEALELGREEMDSVQILVTDVVMPGMNGRTLARRLQERIAGLKILFMSGYAEQLADFKDHEEPGSDFLQKPFSRAELLQKLQKLQES